MIERVRAILVTPGEGLLLRAAFRLEEIALTVWYDRAMSFLGETATRRNRPPSGHLEALGSLRLMSGYIP